MLALIGNLDTSELVIVLVAAVLIFGKSLPQVAAQAGSQLVKLRRSLDQAWRDTGMDDEIRNVKRDLENAIPRDLSLGEMAKIASAEMDKRIRKNEEELAAEKAKDVPVEPAAEPPTPRPTGEPVIAGDAADDSTAAVVAREIAAEPRSLEPMPPPTPPWESNDAPPV